jgi:ADP-ribose pyrophosphatase
MNHRNVRIVAQHLLSDNWYILKKIDFELQRRDGSWQALTREVYDRGNGATIGLYNLAKRTVILIRQFRIPTFVNGHDGYLIETAAGLLDDASPEERVRLEAEEETGYRVQSVRKVYEAFMSPGSVTERLHFFVGEYQPQDRISDGGGLAEEGEDIEVLELPFAEALAMVDDGRIMDGKTIMLLQYLKQVMPTSLARTIVVCGSDDRVALATGSELLQAGHFPLVASTGFGGEVYRDYAKTLLQRCDGVLRVGGTSGSADLIEELAVQLGLPIYRALDEIPVGKR